MRFLFIIALMIVAGSSGAQTAIGRDQEKREPSSLHPGRSEDVFAPQISHKMSPAMKKRLRKHDGPHVETYEEYVARMKRTVKMIRKNERLMKKPQYSNPMYFGHKRPPKKHKPSKMRFCTECGIRH